MSCLTDIPYAVGHVRSWSTHMRFGAFWCVVGTHPTTHQNAGVRFGALLGDEPNLKSILIRVPPLEFTITYSYPPPLSYERKSRHLNGGVFIRQGQKWHPNGVPHQPSKEHVPKCPKKWHLNGGCSYDIPRSYDKGGRVHKYLGECCKMGEKQES